MTHTPDNLRSANKTNGEPRFAFDRLLIVFAPILALIAFTAMLALVAAAVDWYRSEMLIAAAGAGTAAVAVAVAVVLAYRQQSERVAARRSLRAVEARIASIVETAMDPIITVDGTQRIVQFNGAAERVFRWPRAAVLGQSMAMLLPERFRESHRRHVEHFGQTGTTSRRMGSDLVLMGLRANGEEFPVEASVSQTDEGDKKLYTVILRDVTDRVRAEQSLARSEERLRSILDSAMDAIVTVDEAQHIVLFNKAAEAVFGCSRDEAIGAPLAWFIPERFREGHTGYISRFGEAGARSRRMGAQRIVTGLRRNGEEFPIDASISQISENGAKFYTVILRDVTERVRAEEALRRSKEELQELAAASQSVREQEKSRIARELHDELGQALTALKMDVNWLRERLSEKQGQGLETEKLVAMETMLDRTVASTRRISTDLRPLMLDDLGLMPAVEWLVEDFSARTGVACELRVSDPEPDLQDPYATAVFRILQESLTNVARHAKASRVEVSVQQIDSHIKLHVRDNGQGFSLRDARKPKSYGLMGLRERAYLLGGEAIIDSRPGEGTNIDVTLPIAREVQI